MLAHEALHCALGHFTRAITALNGVGMWLAIMRLNLMLAEDGLKPPSGA